MKNFKDQTVLITGASSGIGEEFAKLLAAEKAKVLLTARNEKKLNELAEELASTHGIQTHVFPADLSRPESPAKLFVEIQKSVPHVGLIINNAGFGSWGDFQSVDNATYQEMCNLNMNAIVALTYYFLPSMLDKRAGGFINVASTAAFQPVPYFATYSATKAFVLSFSEAIAAEYNERGITVTCLCPGPTESNFHERSKIDPKKLFGLEPARNVARLGLQAFLKGKPVAISGMKNYVLANSTRFVPRKMVSQITSKLFRPTSQTR
ncbi:MAG: SDR family NAD(P)-dependent oxidoreductase [bacterium]